MSELPDKPPIDHAVLVKADRPYRGDIAVGDVFCWEPELPYARELCLVVRLGPPPDSVVLKHARGVAVISGGTESGVYTVGRDGRECFNEESRFREAVVPTILKGVT